MAHAMDPREFVLELVNQLFHADTPITELAERIDTLEGENARLRAALDPSGAARVSGCPYLLRPTRQSSPTWRRTVA